jgi:hypothetical protein
VAGELVSRAPAGNPRPVDEMFPGADPTSVALRSTDWAATPLGPVESWSSELRAAVRTVLPSRIPMLLWWGPELVQIFPAHGLLGTSSGGSQRAVDCWPNLGRRRLTEGVRRTPTPAISCFMSARFSETY